MTDRSARSGKMGRRVALVVITKIVAWLARILPYRLAVSGGSVLGLLAFVVIRRDRERAKAHLALAFPERTAEWVSRTARRSFMHLGRSLVEALAMDRRRLDSVVEFRGQERIAAALDGGRGAVFITGHIGNWELMADAVAARFPLSVVAAPLKPEAINDMIVRLRDRMGIKTVVRGHQGAVKEIIRSFRENRILGLLIDQDTDVDGAFVDFFGRPAWTPTAAAQMAIKFGAPVVFGYIHRGESGRHRIEIEGPLELVRSSDDAKDIVANTALFTKRIEEVIRRYPEQWVWMHRRWRRQP